MSKDFNYRDFANELRFQVRGIVPENCQKDEKYIRDTVYKMALLCAEALYNDEEINEEFCRYITQIIAEWTFHKTVDMIVAKVPTEYHIQILHKINYEIYEYLTPLLTAYPDETVLKQVENLTTKTYNNALKSLYENKKIDECIYNQALTSDTEEYFVPMSILDVLKPHPYISLLYIICLLIAFVSVLTSFYFHDTLYGFGMLILFLYFLFRFITRESNISVKL